MKDINGKTIWLSDEECDLLYSILATYIDDTEDRVGERTAQTTLSKIM